ncbi:MAG TPA: tetratricopeptide repeat protein [Bacteroidetes bacterium]|nr:tetratricopeptide repeat protein [Bacteroidota bacterium]
MKRLWLVVFILSLSVGFSNLYSSEPDNSPVNQQQKLNQDVENIFHKAVNHYIDKRYDIVEWELQGLLDIYPKNQRITSILYLMGRARYKQGKFAGARQILDQLITQYDNSGYVDDAKVLLGEIAFKQSGYFTAGQNFLSVLDETNDPRLRDRVVGLILPLLTDYVNWDDLQSFQSQFRSKNIRSVLRFAEGVKLFRRGEKERAVTAFQQVVDMASLNQVKSDAEKYLKRIAAAPEQNVKIGIILPLSGDLSEEAKSLLSGIRYAFRKNSMARDLGIQLVVKDSEGDVLTTIRRTKELLQDNSVIAIIGEIESDQTAVIASLAGAKKIPVIAPTAAESGLTELSKNIIQMNPDVSIRGRIIAEYAVKKLNLHTFAILAPADRYGKTITDSFSETVDHLNGSILVQTWYYQGATELRSQFRYIREVGLKKMGRDSVAQQFPDFNLTRIDSMLVVYGIQKRKEMKEKNQPAPKKFTDSTATPVTSIDAIFLPVYTDEIPYVAPQFALFNIKCQILGSDFWNNEDVLDSQESYVSGAIFPSDFYADPVDPVYQKFRNNFRLETGISPGKMGIFGYDSFNLLMSVLKDDVKNPGQVLQRLKHIETFNGLLHSYLFNLQPSVNSFLYILQYTDRTIKRLQ